MPIYTYTISPSPLTQGGHCVITTNAPDGTVLTLDWDPEAQPKSVKVKNGRATCTVPANATSLIVSDQWGNSASTTISP